MKKVSITVPVKVKQLLLAQRSMLAIAVAQGRNSNLTVRIALPHWQIRGTQQVLQGLYRWLPFLRNLRIRLSLAATATVIVAAQLIAILQPFFVPHTYALGVADSLLLPISQPMASKLVYNSAEAAYEFNRPSAMPAQDAADSLGPQTSATAFTDASKGIAVTDPVHSSTFSLAPTYPVLSGKQDGNRIVYPLQNGSGWLVYSMHTIGVKEDLLLTGSTKNTQTFSYHLDLGKDLVARSQSDGSIGVYGNSLLSGNVATGNSKDAALLEHARESAPKNTLMFSIPRPVVKQLHDTDISPRAAYALNGDTLTLTVLGLSKAHYPLTIDPSIYVVSAQQFMNGNDETNIDFDVADSLIRKGATTGARFDSWDPTKNLNAATWKEGVAVAGGFIYTVGGANPSGSVAYYTSPGTDTFTVPANVTSVTVKAWGAGGGGGGGGSAAAGGAGGGGGFVQSTLSVNPGDTLTISVGAGGGNGSFSSGNSGQTAGDGGGGGGYSGVFNSSSTPLLVAAGGAGGGGGGGGGKNATAGGAGGSGGGTSSTAGSASGGAGGGGAASQTAGGSGGTGGNTGANGGSLSAGSGGDGASATNSTKGSANNGGAPGGGNGGNGDQVTVNYAGGGGGGSGYYGGGGGSGAQKTGNGGGAVYSGGGGGGGGSSYTTGTTVTNTAGNGSTPGNSGDGDRNGAGQGGTGGATSQAGSSGSSGVVIISYGVSAANLDTVNWAKFDPLSGAITSADPGSGACAGWCSSTAYSLPAPRKNLTLVAYNRFLYAIGGEDGSCTSANGTGDNGICSTVYIAKLGANGEPQLWSPTSTDKSTWTYWYRDANLSSPRTSTAAVAYNNRMYLLGGMTSSSGTTSVTNTAQVADIVPTGVLGSWSSQTNLPYNLYGHGAQVYNDRLYIIGGASSVGGSPLASVYYNKINSDGTLNSWVQTTSLSSGRLTNGGNFSAAWGGYIYVSGGCKAQNASGYCTSVASDTQQASINADGSLDVWSTNANVSDTRMGHNVVAWRDYIYEIGGCSSQNSTSGICTTGLNTINYGAVNNAGDISTVSKSNPSGSSSCSGTSPYNCDLPSTSTIGQMLNATAIVNGYLYVAGGCTNASCSTLSKNNAYTALNSDGSMSLPANCTADGNTTSGNWCIDTLHNINPGNQGANNTGVAAAGTTVFNSTIYFVGGINGAGLTGQVYYVNINADGSLASSWNYSSMATAGATPVAYDYTYARANPSSASSAPGNLFIFGGCSAVTTTTCNSYTNAVYKCDIQTAGGIANCSTTNQLQIGTVSGASGAGLAGMGGTVYANYIYLIGGTAPGVSGLDTVYYAKINNSNNVVAVSGTAWVLSSNHIAVASQYAAAFGYNGYLYVVGGYNSSSGVLGSIEFSEINVSDGSIGAFATSAATITGSWGMGVPVSSSYAYILGGCSAGAPPGSCSSLQATVQTFQIFNNDSGSTAGYTTAANTYTTAANRLGASATVLNGYLYIAGGCTSTTDCTAAATDVSYAPLDANGSIGSWASTTAALPAARTWGKLETAGGSLYYIGGQSSTATDARTEVYYATPSSGNISSWSTASNGLPAARTRLGAAVWNNRLYVVGGVDSSSAATSTVYVSPQLNSGGDITAAWSTSSPSFNIARSGATVVAYANNLYILGGYDGTNYLSDGQYAQISSRDGSVNSWSYTTSLPTPLRGADGFAVNGYLYLFGGRSTDTTCRPITLVTPISANTTIASGNNPTGLGQWYEAPQRYSGNRYGAAAVYNDGKAYILGGGCGSTLTYASPVIQQTSLLSQPQVAKYSIMMDTDTDVTPNYWLLNGLDNSIGARWQLNYRSMTNPGNTNPDTACVLPVMSTWGQTTNFGDVTLGNPGIYTPKDSSGNNTNCARFFYFNVTVDSSRAFGYPDDVSRGPTITDLTLQFTADPSKRLMHGRTFTGGLQQPDDTPYYGN